MKILGISAFYHDSAAALLIDGQLIAAAQEERFTRVRHDDAMPNHAVQYCLNRGGISIDEIDAVIFYDKPFLKFERILFTHLTQFPRGIRPFLQAVPVWMSQKLWMKSIIRQELKYRGEVYFTEHHKSHAASAFLVSPFDDAAILTVDGVGEWATSTWGLGQKNNFKLLKETRFPHSLGLLYSAFTYYLGFKVNSGEYKVMGLAPYGKPTYYEKIKKLISWKDDGSFKLHLEYFDFLAGTRMTNKKFDELFEGPPRKPESRLTQRDFDLAASIQKITDDIMVTMAKAIRAETGTKNLCLAGGVALNCVSNTKIFEQAGFENVWVQPAAGDAGGAIGAAFYLWNTILANPRTFTMHHAYYGPEYTETGIVSTLDSFAAASNHLPDSDLFPKVAALLAEGKIIGWFQGRMEFGPRALGNRSILADPRHPEIKNIINRAIKFREGFRPFAPSVLEENFAEWFHFERSPQTPHFHAEKSPLPFMLSVATVNKDKRIIPGVTHQDFSARVQTVSAKTNPRYHALISEFNKSTQTPLLVNTSFNVRGEPIVCTPKDAYRCFMRTNMDYLVIGNYLLEKSAQPPWTEKDWRKNLPLD